MCFLEDQGCLKALGELRIEVRFKYTENKVMAFSVQRRYENSHPYNCDIDERPRSKRN